MLPMEERKWMLPMEKGKCMLPFFYSEVRMISSLYFFRTSSVVFKHLCFEGNANQWRSTLVVLIKNAEERIMIATNMFLSYHKLNDIFNYMVLCYPSWRKLTCTVMSSSSIDSNKSVTFRWPLNDLSVTSAWSLSSERSQKVFIESSKSQGRWWTTKWEVWWWIPWEV